MKSLPARIIEAIKTEDVDALRMLLKDSPEQLTWNTPFAGQTWLGYAASNGKIKSIALLLELGADINQGDHREDVKPICPAACNNQIEAVELLLKRGATLDTETSVKNPLFSAVVGRSPNSVKLLLEAGVDYSVRYNSSTMQNMDAIAFALMRGEKECARILASWVAGDEELKIKTILAEADEIAQLNAYKRNA